MPERVSYPAGAPCWADLCTPEPRAAERFYSEVLGWGYIHGGAGFRHYTYANYDDHMVAGLVPLDEDGPGHWIVFLATADAGDTADRVARVGGTVLDGPRDIGLQGRLLVARDTAGAHVGFWQPRAHIGAGLYGEPTGLCWIELEVADLAAADRFYTAVLGYTLQRHDGTPDTDYAAFHLDGAAVAGRTRLPEVRPRPDPFWLPYFAVSDVDHAARRASACGGVLAVEPVTTPNGRLAVISDPWGATFAVITLSARPGR